MAEQTSKRNWTQDVFLILLAILLSGIIFIIDIHVPLGVAMGVMYCIVILYSWLLPGRYASMYTAAICTILVIVGLSLSQDIRVNDSLVGINRIISIIAIWICATLVLVAKQGLSALKVAHDNLEEKVYERTKELHIKQALIEQSEKKYKGLIDSAPDAIVIVDKSGKIQLVNYQTEKMFGYNKEELLDQKVELLIPDKVKPHHHEHLQGYFGSPSTRNMGSGMELYAAKKNGATFPVQISLSPVETEDGVLVTAAIRDITKQKKSEAAAKKVAALKAKGKEMEQFAYIASHDLREPLLTIKNYLNILMEDYGHTFTDEAAHFTHSIMKAANRMEELITGLLDYSRLSQSKSRKEIDCNEIITSLTEDLDRLIKYNHATIKAENLPTISAYPLELKLLFQNLIQNAIKFGKKDINPVIEISSKPIDGGWQFSVRDNGIGIQDKHKDKIFTIFKKLHKKKEYEGTGIGLAHAKKISEIHNGDIWVESELGKGSTFYFTILNEFE